LEAARRDMERERRDMAAEIARLEAENAAQAEDVARLSASLEDKAALLDKAEKAETALRIENARLDERSKAAEARAEDLKQELAQLHSRFQELAASRLEGEGTATGKTAKAKKSPPPSEAG
jgi:chromosome segregation ATPase